MRGEYRHAIDAKNRIFLPAKLREALGENLVVSRGTDKCVNVYSEEKWAEAISCDSEFLFGDSMLIAPILGDKNERDVWLPKGVWYDFFTGKRFEGGTHTVCTEGVPVFVKDKTLLPVAKPVDHVDRDTCFEITLKAFGDCSKSVCRLVEDSDDSKNAEYKVLSLSQNYLVIGSFLVG